MSSSLDEHDDNNKRRKIENKDQNFRDAMINNKNQLLPLANRNE